MRIPFLRPKAEEAAATAPPKTRRTRAAKVVPVVDDVLDVQAARTQARRRLVGAVVLLAIGVIGFPVLFETQPRPLPMDTPMQAVRRDSAVVGLVTKDSAGPTRSQPVAMPPADAGNEVAAPAAASVAAAVAVPTAKVAASAAASGVVRLASAPQANVPSAAPAPAPASASASVTPKPAAAPVAATVTSALAPAPAPASAAARPAAEAVPADAAPSRFVVQAGAYKESGKLREARSKIEGLGYKTYTQVVENDNGSRTRVRVGPYATHEEAEAVAAKLKKNGLPAAIVKL